MGETRRYIIFCEQTQYAHTTLYYWRKKDRVPEAAFAAVQSIDRDACDQNRFKGFHTKSFFKRVVELSNEGKTIRVIADILTRETGRKITEGAIKSARFRHKDDIENYKSRTKSASLPDEEAQSE